MLDAGTGLGPYRITAPLGAGGMGEVYRAHDTRLGRDVAVKVITAAFSRDPDRVRRFEQEARVASALNHPSIISMYDFGMHEGAPYVVMELLEGESLRSRLRQGPIPLRKVLEYGAQTARGLAAAHAKGIVHRDLKPENLFLTREGRVKILDFGLAKLSRPELSEAPDAPTVTKALTSAGAILGTVGYMSPEQVRGESADHRSDLFSLGTILHEMVTGERAFRGESSVETLNAILKEEPGPLSAAGREVPPAVEGIIRHCLEKNPEERFQSARDLAFALEGQGGVSAVSGVGLAVPVQKRAAVWRRPAFVALAAVVAIAAVSAATFLWTRQTVQRPVPSYARVTLRRGNVLTARFTLDGQSVLYSATWDGKPREVFSQRLGSTDARTLGLTGSRVMAAAENEMAIVLPNFTLARVPLDGGTPREVVEGVWFADLSRDGTKFLIVRFESGQIQLECPPGRVLLQRPSEQWINGPRLSPRGDLIAFEDNTSFSGSEGGGIVVMDLSGRKRLLTKTVGGGIGMNWSPESGWFETLGNVAWSSDGREVWFVGSVAGTGEGLYAVTLSGKVRLVTRLPGGLYLQDIAGDGRVLLTRRSDRTETRGKMAGDSLERNLSWLDGTADAFPSADGTRLVFNDSGGTYLWRMDGSRPLRLADEGFLSVSPDWRWIICRNPPQTGIKLVPIGAGETKVLPLGTLADVFNASWQPDGKRIRIGGREAGQPARGYIQEPPDGLPRPENPEDVTERGQLSPDGRWVLATPPDGGLNVLYPVRGGEPRAVPGLEASDGFLCWGEDSRSLFVMPGMFYGGSWIPARVVRLDLQTGRRQTWLELVPPDRTGVNRIDGVAITPNGRYYTYCFMRQLSDLYVAEGLKWAGGL